MLLLANESVPLPSIRRLRDDGWDVFAVAEAMPGATDEDVLALARGERRVLITFDRDYGQLIFQRGLPVPAGLIYLRVLPADPLEPALLIGRLLQRSDWVLGHFITVSADGIRRRPLP